MANRYANDFIGAAIVTALSVAIVSVLFMLQGVVPVVHASNVIAPNVIATAVVPSSCAISLNTFSVSFSTINPGTNSLTTSMNVLDTNGGNVGTFIWVYGSDWNGGASSFGVSNTVWSSSSATGYGSGNSLTTSTVNTVISVASAGSSSLWFGVGVPAGQAANVYTQNVVITNVC